MKKLLISLLALLAAAAIAAGCSQSKQTEQPQQQNNASETKQETPAPAASEFTGKSADGRLEVRVKVSGTVALVEMTAKDFTWNKTFAAKEPKDPVNKENEGHAILTLDSNEPLYVGTMRTSLTDLQPGEHTLKVQLVNNDNSPMGIEATVNFTVK